MTPMNEKMLVEKVDSAIRKLIAVQHFYAGSLVSMPVLYPSGASVVLEMSAQSTNVFVSDRGGGFVEAECMGASKQFLREAERIASEFGIRFDGRDMFVAEVPFNRLEGAMTVVATASSHAAAMAAQKSAERQERFAKEAMFEKLINVFGNNGFKREVEMIGASNHKWRIDALIDAHERSTIFNSVTKSYVSAAGTAAKFYDLARLENPPRRIAVVPSFVGLGDWYGVVSGASDAVLELSAANDHFQKARSAA
jgi:hypothetical protein